MNLEEIVFNLIVHSGNAKGYCFEALNYARKQEFIKADELISKAKDELLEAHHIQTQMIQDEASGKKQEVNLLMVHAQDHLMTSSLAKDLIVEMIEMLKDKSKN